MSTKNIIILLICFQALIPFAFGANASYEARSKYLKKIVADTLKLPTPRNVTVKFASLLNNLYIGRDAKFKDMDKVTDDIRNALMVPFSTFANKTITDFRTKIHNYAALAIQMIEKSANSVLGPVLLTAAYLVDRAVDCSVLDGDFICFPILIVLRLFSPGKYVTAALDWMDHFTLPF